MIKLIFCILLLNISTSVASDKNVSNSINIQKAWVREPIPGIKNSSAYLIIQNSSNKRLKLISASSPYFQSVELHSNTHENGVMKMRKLNYVIILPKKSTEFKMMSNHLMLFGLKDKYKSIKSGDEIPFKLLFEKQNSVEFKAIVKRPK